MFIRCILTSIMCYYIVTHPIADPEQLLQSLSLAEKIGQLFMVPAISDEILNTNFMEYSPYTMDEAYVTSLITDYHVGGIIFLGAGTIASQYALTQRLQASAKIPLLIGQDCEWGLAMRLRDAIKFPYAITLGAIQDDTLIYNVGFIIGRQCCTLGIHLNFAPVADINTNPDNPVIGYRSFGSEPNNVARKATAFARGLCDGGILACAKHFPGHGDTIVDSHYDLPVLPTRLEAVELHPFRRLIKDHIPALMTAHIASPLDPTRTPASLSAPIISDLLRNELGFNGLIVTDGLGMQAVTQHKLPGHVELEALLAGNDLLVCPTNVPAATTLIMQAIAEGTLSEKTLDTHVLRILRIKRQIISDYPCAPGKVTSILHAPDAYALKKRLFESAITLVRDTTHMIPLAHNTPIAHLHIGTTDIIHVTQSLSVTHALVYRHLSSYADCASVYEFITSLPQDTPLIITLAGTSKYAKDQYGIDRTTRNFIDQLARSHPRTLLVLFANPYAVTFFKTVPSLICAYEDEPEAHEAVAKILIGDAYPLGLLPV